MSAGTDRAATILPGRAPGAPVVVCGLGYGDEGKGATVDYVASQIGDTAAVVRWSGGAQAAHNVIHGPRHHEFRQFGSATLLDVQTLLVAPMLVDPIRLAGEATRLEALGVRDPLSLIVADSRCLVTTPIHAAMVRARELLRGAQRHGSTGVGIGEAVAYAQAIAMGASHGDIVGDAPAPADVTPGARALTLGDLSDRAATVRALDDLARYAQPLLELVDDGDVHFGSIDEMASALRTVAAGLEISDAMDTVMARTMAEGTVIFEGSQGVLLDEWVGFHPNTTWSTVTPGELVRRLRMLGADPYVLGITRTYATRHGAGPMPTEDAELVLAEPHNREGRYQGAWRTGHLDLPALRYAAQACGRIDGVVVNHVDALAGGNVRVADSWGGDPAPLVVPQIGDLEGAALNTKRAWEAAPDLRPAPGDVRGVLELISTTVGAPVVVTADGPSRTDRTPW